MNEIWKLVFGQETRKVSPTLAESFAQSATTTNMGSLAGNNLSTNMGWLTGSNLSTNMGPVAGIQPIGISASTMTELFCRSIIVDVLKESRGEAIWNRGHNWSADLHLGKVG